MRNVPIMVSTYQNQSSRLSGEVLYVLRDGIVGLR